MLTTVQKKPDRQLKCTLNAPCGRWCRKIAVGNGDGYVRCERPQRWVAVCRANGGSFVFRFVSLCWANRRELKSEWFDGVQIQREKTRMMVLFEAKNECFMDIDQLQAELDEHYGRKTTMDDMVAYGEVRWCPSAAAVAWAFIDVLNLFYVLDTKYSNCWSGTHQRRLTIPFSWFKEWTLALSEPVHGLAAWVWTHRNCGESTYTLKSIWTQVIMSLQYNKRLDLWSNAVKCLGLHRTFWTNEDWLTVGSMPLVIA